jgi:hypothetical protein
MKVVTRRTPAPAGRKRRRKEDSTQGFEPAAKMLLHRLGQSLILENPHSPWGAFVLLQLWCSDYLAGANLFDISSYLEQKDGLSPHL